MVGTNYAYQIGNSSGAGFPLNGQFSNNCKKDTIYNNKKYYIVEGQIHYAEDWGSMYANFYNRFYIYDDSINRKVYFNSDLNSNDTLLYDFSLNIGDTLNSFFVETFQPMILDSISFRLINTNYHREFYFHPVGNNFIKNSIIEGVGGTEGFVHYGGYFESGASLICYTRDSISLYPTDSLINPNLGNYSLCAWPLNANNYNKKMALEIIESNSQIMVKNNENESISIEILNVWGSKIYFKENIKDNFVINKESFINGFYFVRVGNHQSWKQQKFVIQ